MTRSGVNRIVAGWQRRLRLDHWKITVEWGKPCGDGTVAETRFEDQYDIASLYLSPKWPGWETDYANQTVVHELLHLHERDLHLAIKSAAPLLGKPAYTLFYDRLEHEREGVVDRVASILVDGWGSIE